MRTSTRPLLFLLVLIVLGICAYRYYDYVIKQDYDVVVNAPCDPTAEQCFVSDCDPSVVGCDTSPYEKVDIHGSSAPKCLLEHTCTSFSCDGLKQCSIAYCSTDALGDGEACVSADTMPSPAATSTATSSSATP